MTEPTIIEGETTTEETPVQEAIASQYGDFYTNVPFTDNESLRVLSERMEQRKDIEKYQEFVLTVPSLFSTINNEMDKDVKKIACSFWETLGNQIDGFDYVITPIGSPVDAHLILSSDAAEFKTSIRSQQPLSESMLFSFKPRFFVEENMSFVQLVSVIVIKSEDGRYLMLQNTDQVAMDNQATFVQGHVSYDKSMYTLPRHEFLRNNAIKELDEEVILVKGDLDTTMGELLNGAIDKHPTLLLYSKQDLISLEHMGLVYVAVLPNESFDYIVENARSNEPEKHSLIVKTADDNVKLDSWSQAIMDFIK